MRVTSEQEQILQKYNSAVRYELVTEGVLRSDVTAYNKYLEVARECCRLGLSNDPIQKVYELACCNLGACYQAGRGCPQDLAEAYRLYQIASTFGNGLACYQMAVITQDEEAKKRLLAEALQKECYESHITCQVLCDKYDEIIIAPIKPFQRHIQATSDLARRCAVGDGMPKNEERALKLYTSLIKEGHIFFIGQATELTLSLQNQRCQQLKLASHQEISQSRQSFFTTCQNTQGAFESKLIEERKQQHIVATQTIHSATLARFQTNLRLQRLATNAQASQNEFTKAIFLKK